MALSLLPALASGGGAKPLGLALISYLLQCAGFFLIPLFSVCRVYGGHPGWLGLQRLNMPFCLKRGLPAGLILFLLNLLTSLLVTALLPASWIEEQSIVALLSSTANVFETVMLALFILVFAPIAEEIIFRAYLYPPLKSGVGRRRALVFASLIFAASHINVAAFLPLFVGGLGFCWLYDRYGNIYINIIAHIVWNTIAMILFYI